MKKAFTATLNSAIKKGPSPALSTLFVPISYGLLSPSQDKELLFH